jgi:hypothetical protein
VRGRPMEVQRCDIEPSESEVLLRRPKPRVSWPTAAKPQIRRADGRKGTGIGVKFCVLTRGGLSASAYGR